MKIISTPFQFRGSGYLGPIYRPYLVVELSTSKIDEWIPVEMIVDTGADYCLLPKKYAQILQIDIEKDCFLNETIGIGGKEKVHLFKNLSARINHWERKIPAGFLSRDDIPALLGRLQCLEVLKLLMENHITKLEK